MNNAPMHMDQYMHTAFWLKNRITITFQPDYPTLAYLSPTDAAVSMPDGNNMPAEGEMNDEEAQMRISPPTFIKTDAITSIRVEDFKQLFRKDPRSVFSGLQDIDVTDTLRAPGTTPPTNKDLVGKYIFSTRGKQGTFVPTLVCFFKFDPTNIKLPVFAPTASAPDNTTPTSMESMPGMGSPDPTPPMPGNGSSKDGNTDGQSMQDGDPVVTLVNFINNHIDEIRNTYHIPILGASPTYYVGAAPNTWPVGCPVAPPIPVGSNTQGTASSSLWPITLHGLPIELERATGEGVNVLVLDTLPHQEEINRAAEGAGEHNLLLLDVVNNVVMHHYHLPHQIDDPNPLQPKTGKDVKGRLSGGFRMADHGLAVAGIIRSIAPNAHVECIRALNDFCAGDGTTFIKALETIHNRMLAKNPDDNLNQGDLYQQPVIINLSLVVPPDSMLSELGLQSLANVRKDLLYAMQGLADLGVIFAASAGNEGDARYQPANPNGVRPDALYPAAFAYNGLVPGHRIIPVGAAAKNGQAASYSCYPGNLGIATYGGDVPTQFKKDTSGCFTQAENIDAVIGLYTGLAYPSLLLEDCEPTYPAPNGHAWAYWSGTSFATPIVAGLVARILENEMDTSGTFAPPALSVPQILMNANATQQITWDRLDPDFRNESGPMLMAVQDTLTKPKDDHDRKEVEHVFNFTLNESQS